MAARNRTMSILTGIAMILVVLGHIDLNVLTIGGLFPYYSFHVLIFVFVSGYFYKSEDEEKIGAFVVRKIKRLLLPYYIWNIFFAIVSTVLSGRGFVYCSKFTIFNFFVEPFLGGHQYGLNFAAWFVPALFLIELFNIIIHRFLGMLRLKNDRLILIAELVVGFAVVYLAQGGHVWGYYKTPGRILFMLPVFQMGLLYKSRLEAKDKLPWYIFFPAILIIQFVIIKITGGAVNFSAVWCTGFASMCFIPYLTIITGIAFWLHIAKLLDKYSICLGFNIVGDNSFQVMMLHPGIFFIINLISMTICRNVNPAISFDTVSFMENVNYSYLPGGYTAWKLVYVICAVVIPILCSYRFWRASRSHSN